MQAFEKGLKGCTTFRPSEHITGVLIKKDEAKEKKEPQINLGKRPTQLEGTTYKIKTPLSADALYVTINDVVQGGYRHPYELFINTKNLQHFSWIVAMSRMISAVFRHEHDPSFMVEELKSIYDPNGGYFSNGEYIPSLAADIGRVIETHLIKIGIMPEKNKPADTPSSDSGQPTSNGTHDPNGPGQFMICPQCNALKLISQENCLKCLSCGYSKCS